MHCQRSAALAQGIFRQPTEFLFCPAVIARETLGIRKPADASANVVTPHREGSARHLQPEVFVTHAQ